MIKKNTINTNTPFTKNHFTILGIILLSVFNSSKSLIAQQELFSYTIENIPNNKQLNPANPTEKGINISLMNFYSSVDMNGPTLNQIGFSDDNKSIKIDALKIGESLHNENLININSYLQTVNVDFTIKGLEFSLGHGIRQQFHALYTKDLIQLFVVGNEPYIGKTMHLAPSVDLSTFHQINLGFSTSFGKLRIGTNLKLLNGINNVSSSGNIIDLYTSDDIYQLQLNNRYTINSSGILSRVDEKFETSFDDLKSFQFTDSNSGFLADFGAIYQVNDKLTLSASILDLGSISWGTNTNNYKLEDNPNFDGLELDDIINSGETISLKDSIEAIVSLEETKTKYKTSVSSSFYLSGSYKWSNKLTLSGLYYRQFHDDFSSNALAISSFYKLNNVFQFGAQYAIKDNNYTNLGLSAKINLSVFRFFIMTDNILAVTNIKSAKYFNLRIGGAIVL